MASSYTAKDILVLEGLEPVRRRPGMYIGGVDAAGLHPGRLGWRVRFQPGGRKVVEIPLDEGEGPIAGYALVEVRSREEALEWSRRFPTGPAGAHGIEVRQLIDPDPPRPPAESLR